VRLQTTVCKNVLYRDAKFGKRASDQNGSVAIQWFLLSAHQRDTVLARAADHTIDAATEQIRARQTRVLNAPMLITPQIVRPCSEFGPQEHVLDVFGLQVVFQRLSVKLWIDAAVWGRAHVRKSRHAMATQQGQKNFYSVRRVADSENWICQLVHPNFHVR